ncbi:MAG: major capsid protein [Armatimonadota bacterium]|nr:major capsid protein [bacterium]
MQTALLGNYDTATMLEVVRATPRVKTFLRDRLVGGNIKPVETQDVMFDFVKGTRSMAPIVSRVIGGKLVEKQSVVTGKYRPPMLAPRGVFRGDEAFERMPGEVIGGAASPDERAAAYAAEQILAHETLIARRWEWMWAKLLSTGVISLEGEGVKDTITVGHTLNVVLNGADLWNTATADILGDIDDGCDEVIEACGITPDTLILGKDAAKCFMANEKVQKALDVRNFNVGSVNPRELPNGAVYIGTYGPVEIFRYPEWYRDDTTKASTPMIPVGAAILCCSQTRNPSQKMVFGAHFEVAEERTYVSELIPRVWTDKPSNTRFLEVVSYPVPIIPDVDSWLVMTVL